MGRSPGSRGMAGIGFKVVQRIQVMKDLQRLTRLSSELGKWLLRQPASMWFECLTQFPRFRAIPAIA